MNLPGLPVLPAGQMVLRIPPGEWPQGLPQGYEVKLYSGERKVWRSHKSFNCSAWAEKYRFVSMSSRRGQWHNETTPYLTDIMDASWFPSVRKVICCKTPQVGMTEAVNNCIGYAIDCDPAPVLYVYPDESTARHNSTARVQKMITETPQLAAYTTGKQDDLATLEIELQHMALYMAWASSTAGLANKPIKYLVLDEVDKYPPAGKRETDPISLAELRLTTYEDESKVWEISTPTVESGPIWKALMGSANLGERSTGEAQVVYRYWVCCPLCGCLQLMRFGEGEEEGRKPGGIRFPKDERNPEVIESKRLAWYECEHCQGEWNDALRNRAVRLGEWRDEAGRELKATLRVRRPTKIGFHIPAWISPFVSLSKCVGEFLRGLKDKDKMRNFMNAIKAEPWVDYQVERSEDRILALRDERPEGVAPSGGVIAGITAGVDTQDDGFWYEVRAWGHGRDQESWQVRAGFVQSFEALDTVLFEEPITDALGNNLFVELAVIDSQGHRTAEVYEYARRNRGRVLPLKGEQRMTQPVNYTNLEYYPTRDGKKRPIPGGLQLVRADVTYFKNRLSSLLEIGPADPGAWHLHSACTEAWARHMTAEYLDERGLWACPAHKANHGWDCGVYNLVAAEVRRIKYRQPPEAVQQERQQRPTGKASPVERARKLPSWMNRR